MSGPSYATAVGGAPARLVLGTRGSALALAQAHEVAARLADAHPGLTIEVERISTQGDRLRDAALSAHGGKGLFVREIEEALVAGRIDLAVHSLKDMPVQQPAGLVIGAVPAREDPHDVLITRDGGGLMTLPAGARVGTSSLRRQAQVLAARPHVTVVPLRGNLDTRLRKLQSEELDAIIVAAAGLHRLAVPVDGEVLPYDRCLPAIGQGALALECRKEDGATRALLAPLDDSTTRAEVTAERACLRHLGGGCHAPIAALAVARQGHLTLSGLVARPDGTRLVRYATAGRCEEAEAVGAALAETLFALGAAEILRDIYGDAWRPGIADEVGVNDAA